MKKFIAAAIAATALTSAVNATSIVQNINFDNRTTDFTASSTFNLFDSTLGTLNSVVITSAFGFTTTITVQNNASGGSDGDAATLAYLQTGSSNSAINALLLSSFDTSTTSGFKYGLKTDTKDADGNGQDYSVGAGQSVTLDAIAATNVGKTTTLTSGLSAFTGAAGSTADFIASTLTKTSLNNTGGNTTATQSTNANADFTITYNYTSAVPEPMTWAMMIGGFGLVGYGLRRKGVSVAFN